MIRVKLRSDQHETMYVDAALLICCHYTSLLDIVQFNYLA